MPCIIPDCTSCKNLYEEKINGSFCCKAFPDGIPKDYFWGSVDVKNIIECNYGYKFEDYRQK